MNNINNTVSSIHHLTHIELSQSDMDFLIALCIIATFIVVVITGGRLLYLYFTTYNDDTISYDDSPEEDIYHG